MTEACFSAVSGRRTSGLLCSWHQRLQLLNLVKFRIRRYGRETFTNEIPPTCSFARSIIHTQQKLYSFGITQKSNETLTSYTLLNHLQIKLLYIRIGTN